MELELEPSVKPLLYKVKSVSRESPSQKASHVLDTDLRNHWTTGTNTKEWILLELEEPCLLSHIRVHNKSVLEWEIVVGLRYKPEAFMKVRPRCEAPRRDMIYPMNYVACRYVRISCLRGNPIAIFFIQLFGIPVAGLESEFQPIVDHLLPSIISHKQDANNVYLQLLQDITRRLLPFIPHLEADLCTFSEAAQSNIRFFAMLAGPFYPILFVANERENMKATGEITDLDGLRSNQVSVLTVSSNFEPRRMRSPTSHPAVCAFAFRPNVVLMLLKKAYKDVYVGNILRSAARAFQKLMVPDITLEAVVSSTEGTTSVSSDTSKLEPHLVESSTDYSHLFGEEFKIDVELPNVCSFNFLDAGLVEEGILHILYACAAEPILCSKLHDCRSDFWSVLPLVQALLPALRPSIGSSMDQVDESFTHWKQPIVQRAVAQVVTLLSSSVYHPLLDGCASYLTSHSPTHVKAASVLIDLCAGPLSQWIPQIVAKVDLAMELLEDLLPVIQGSHQWREHAFAALKYVLLALSGSVDDILAKYKEVKHKLLFLVEMLGPFLDPAIRALDAATLIGDISAVPVENMEESCAMALNIIRTAVWKPAVLPSLELEWRRGSVAPSVLLAVLGPGMRLPDDIDSCKSSVGRAAGEEPATKPNEFHTQHDGFNCKSENSDYVGKSTDASDVNARKDTCEDAAFLFAPSDLKYANLRSTDHHFKENMREKQCDTNSSSEDKKLIHGVLNNQLGNNFVLDIGFGDEYLQMEANYVQLVYHQVCELRASEFHRLALELHSQSDITPESHDVAIDSLLSSAECHVNPFFLKAFRPCLKNINILDLNKNPVPTIYEHCNGLRKHLQKGYCNLETVAKLERKRDRTVLQILLEAAQLDFRYCKHVPDEEFPYEYTDFKQSVVVASLDFNSADAITLVRQNQKLLCQFLVNRLKKRKHSMHEVLMRSLLFLLHSATELVCPPENVIDILLDSAEHINRLVMSFYYNSKDGKTQLDPEKVYEAKRWWMLLQQLVIASSGSGGDDAFFMIHGRGASQYQCLIPLSAWMDRVPVFSSCPFPLVRFIGWMGISRYAKQYMRDGLSIGVDFSQLTTLLSIFTDELASVNGTAGQKIQPLIHESGCHENLCENPVVNDIDQSTTDAFLRIYYPEFYEYFPNMKRRFETFAENILDSVQLRLRSTPSSFIPDVLCWFSDLCLLQFVNPEKEKQCINHVDHLKGYAAKNVKGITLYLIEGIVSEHMEAMIPELPRVVQVLVSLCRTSYCDVDFLGAVLRLLKPLISYALEKVSCSERNLTDDSSCLDFESLCFDALFDHFKSGREPQTSADLYHGSLMIFLLGAIFTDLSVTKRKEIMHSLVLWTDFVIVEPTSTFYDYLRAFENVIGSCNIILVESLSKFGIPTELSGSCSDESVVLRSNESLIHEESCVGVEGETSYSLHCETGLSKHQSHGLKYFLSSEEIIEFSKDLERLILKLYPAIEVCWKVHHQLAKRLSLTIARCYLYSACIVCVCQSTFTSTEGNMRNLVPSHIPVGETSIHWRSALESFVKGAFALVHAQCWQGASMMLDYLLGLHSMFELDHVLPSICLVIKHFCYHAPKLSWRLQTDKWLSSLFSRSLSDLQSDAASSLVDLFSLMLEHSEPEQRAMALKHLQRLVAQGSLCGNEVSTCAGSKATVTGVSIGEQLISLIVTKTWDRVAALASSDSSVILRSHAMALLSTYVPFAERAQLQSFLVAADSILPGLVRLGYSMWEGPLVSLSLRLLATACLYCPMDDILLIPESIWRSLRAWGTSKADGLIGSVEKMACEALCKIKSEGTQAKEVLKEVLTGDVKRPIDPEFKGTRESIIQVIASLTSAQSYADFFSNAINLKNVELEEAEIELELLMGETALQDACKNLSDETNEWRNCTSIQANHNQRLEQIKAEIQKLEKAKLREEVAARRQKKLLVWHSHQKFLESASLRELELIQDLDRERIKETEREAERQKQLEQERAKTRELRHNLDMEIERRTQRELQRELEQKDSGTRSRREFSSSAANSRPRDRYRERESGRPPQEATGRPNSAGEGGPEGAITPPTVGASMTSSATPAVVLSGARSYTIQPPMILHSRERSEEYAYDDSFDGSRDSGDGGSIGDPDSVSMDGTGGGFGQSHRHGPRGSKPRQIVERRERDGRREGKWERKHS